MVPGNMNLNNSGFGWRFVWGCFVFWLHSVLTGHRSILLICRGGKVFPTCTNSCCYERSLRVIESLSKSPAEGEEKP